MTMSTERDKELFLEFKGVDVQNHLGELKNINWRIYTRQHWAIVGGPEKSLLATTITGKVLPKKGELSYYFFDVNKNKYEALREQVAYLSFAEDSNLFNYSNYYYQQRFQAAESDGGITVQEYFSKCSGSRFEELLKLFQLEELMDRQFIKLSNGQIRKARTAKALINSPRLLILEEPYVGLDQQAKNHFSNVLNHLANTETQIVLVSSSNEFPDCITHVLEVESGSSNKETERKYFHPLSLTAAKACPSSLSVEPDFNLVREPVVQFARVNISYGEKPILENINWTIQRGEKWALLGPNGAGKSTIMSLITADNPQSYSQDIWLFGKKRGTGESIWDIKKKIGFVSPEIHLYFRQQLLCREVAATGFTDTQVLNRCLLQAETETLNDLINYFNLDAVGDTPFLKVSIEIQKLILFIRALVKNPPLLILDEPFQGMNQQQINQCQAILDSMATSSRTIILTTHNPSEIPAFVNRFFRIDKGKRVSD